MFNHFLQVKTNEYKVPFECNEEDQTISKQNVKKGIEQLEHDILRLLELCPDVKAKEFDNIGTMLAFPLCKEKDERYLTKEDFLEGNELQLLQKLGVPMDRLDTTPDPKTVSIYQRVTCRYLGIHSMVPCKSASESLSHSMNMLGQADRSLETVFDSQVRNIQEDVFTGNKTLKTVLANDAVMKEVKLSIEKSTFKTKFKEKYPKLDVDELKLASASSEQMFDRNGMHPIFGKVIEKALEVVDEMISHQGPREILKYFKEKKIVALNENGEEMKIKDIVGRHVGNCQNCIFVQQMKTKYLTDGSLIQILDEEDISSVLKFSDEKHQGLREAGRRIKSWCDFQGFDERVGLFIISKLS